jgi:DNA repair ATPase RecN
MATRIVVGAARPSEMAEFRIPIYIPELEIIMADVKDTQAKVEALSGQLTEMQTRINEDVQALKDKLAAADIDAAVLNEVNAGLDSISQRVQAIDPDPSNPTPQA